MLTHVLMNTCDLQGYMFDTENHNIYCKYKIMILK